MYNKKYRATIRGLNLLQNRMFAPHEFEDGTLAVGKDKAENEEQNWTKKMYVHSDGSIYFPSECFHQCLKDAASHDGKKIPGRGNKTYKSIIEKEMIADEVKLDVNINTDLEKRIFKFGKMVNGTPNSPKAAKVWRIRPEIRNWTATVEFHVLNDVLSEDILRHIIATAGIVQGLGDWRPTYGRFNLISLEEIG